MFYFLFIYLFLEVLSEAQQFQLHHIIAALKLSLFASNGALCRGGREP